jgi:hypothetical protein
MTSIEELEGLTYTKYINIKDGLKIIQNWSNIIAKLPEHRRNKILEGYYICSFPIGIAKAEYLPE